ncbi:probable polygalacturonase At1g80170 [Humulus lupulus]|uniref:probable polygalacturonase At1g80170 n=1 Tax=Humulus lupulus TaxID=3486 RepID=UPI002B406A50|nr:probable polygalacturonase At1g80170 [Humulus lupulus]
MKENLNKITQDVHDDEDDDEFQIYGVNGGGALLVFAQGNSHCFVYFKLVYRSLLVKGIDYSTTSLEMSGTITSPKDPKAWSGLNPCKWLYIHEVNHLTIEGGGTINGMGHEWWSRSCKRTPEKAITFHK